MFLASEFFWKSAAWGSGGTGIGILVMVLYMALTTSHNSPENVRNRKLRFMGTCVFCVCGAVFSLGYPINHLYELGVLACGISGGAFYVLGLSLIRWVLRKLRDGPRTDIMYTGFAYATPTVFIGIVLGVCNFYWLRIS